MISYKPLWKTLIDKDLKRTDLLHVADISRTTLAKMAHDEPVNLKVVDAICRNLDVPVTSVIEFVHETTI